MDTIKIDDSILFSQNPNPMFIYFPKTLIILEVNDAAVKKYGYSMKELKSMTVWDLRIEEDHQLLIRSLPIRESGFEETGIVRHRKKDGQIMWVRITSQPISHDGIGAIMSSIFDVTDIKKNEERLLFHLNNSPLAWIEWDSNLKIKKWSERARELFGWNGEEVLGRTPLEFEFGTFKDREIVQREISELIENAKIRSSFEIQVKSKTGSIVHCIWHNSVLLGKEDHLISIFSQIEDITEQRQTEKQLHLLNTAVEAADNGIVITDNNGSILWVNSAFSEMTGYSFQEAIGKKTRILKSGFQDASFYKEMWDTILAGKVWNGELTNRRKDGSLYIEGQTITPVLNINNEITHFIAIKRDITNKIKVEATIRKSLREKETLLAEIHHRVKNNLAIISSLLELQDFKVNDDQLHEMLRDSQMRIKSIALIHEKLYHFDQLSEIDFDNYISDLFETISKTYKINLTNINANLDLKPIKLGISQAMPGALILNELITNTFKHAFKNRKSGTLRVRLDQDRDWIIFQTQDNGIGLPPDFDITKEHSLGMSIIRRLTDQLDGSLDIKDETGTCVTVQFPKKEYGDNMTAPFF